MFLKLFIECFPAFDKQPSPFACANAVVRIPQGGIITFPETIRK
jgi:hypothetical protein